MFNAQQLHDANIAGEEASRVAAEALRESEAQAVKDMEKKLKAEKDAIDAQLLALAQRELDLKAKEDSVEEAAKRLTVA